MWNVAASLLLVCTIALAQTPPPPAQRLPPPGIGIGADEREELTERVAALHGIDTSASLVREPARWPDVEILTKAVDWALRYDEFFDRRQVTVARTLLALGEQRVTEIQAGRMPWLTSTGLVVRGYRSKLDGSVQPYGLVIPADWNPEEERSRPLLVWLLGRNNQRTELAFLAERLKSAPPFNPGGAIVLVPYGRFCNATKFAGEVDVFEAISVVKDQFRVDPNRVAVAGFSMGGASAWHLAVHHSGLWCVASPGAGFAETAIYTQALAAGKVPPPWWEQKLWSWYDATRYAGNLFNCPTIAYSGELDPQKLSADLMEQAMDAEGLKLERVIGPETAHKYHPRSAQELSARLESLVARGRDPIPAEVRWTTYTLRYPEVAWVRVEGLGTHWERADVRARLAPEDAVHIQTTNVTELKLALAGIRSVTIDQQELAIPSGSDLSFSLDGNRWRMGAEPNGLRKQPGLTGPVDDAFMEPFIFVVPTGDSFHDRTGAWVQGELAHATKMWRDLFRGDVPKVDDKALSASDLASKNIILWGDPSSNRVLKRILEGLPLKWTAEQVQFGGASYAADRHMPILIFPNPANPRRYVVLNSGIDFRDDAYGTNAKQTPKLPDWAMIDLDTPPGPRWPGRVAVAGFFDEEWKWKHNPAQQPSGSGR